MESKWQGGKAERGRRQVVSWGAGRGDSPWRWLLSRSGGDKESGPADTRGQVFRGGGTQWEGSGAHQDGKGEVKWGVFGRWARGGQGRGVCPGLCRCSENLAFSSWERWDATRRIRTNECQDLTSERSIRWLWGQTAGRRGGLGWGAGGSQICMRGTREKKREQRLLWSHWAGRVGLLLLKMRKTVDGVKEQMGKLGRGRGWRGGGIWFGMWLLRTRVGRSVGWGNTNSRAKSGWTHTRTNTCVYVYVYEWPAYTWYWKLWNWVWRENRVKLSLKVYEDLTGQEAKETSRTEKEGTERQEDRRDSTVCWGLR